MPKTKSDGSKTVESIVNDVLVKLGLRKKDEQMSEAQIMAANREKGEQITALLCSAYSGLNKSQYVGIEEDRSDSEEAIKEKIAAMIRTLQNAPTIFDDIHNIDDMLIFCANSLNEGIKEGKHNKVVWSISALSSGIIYSRDNIPADKAEYKEKLLDERVKYLEKYKTIIKTYDELDDSTATINNLKRALKEAHEKFDPACEKLKELEKTEEGMKNIGLIRIKANNPGELAGTPAGELAEEIKRVALMAHNIFIKDADLATERSKQNVIMARAEDIRTELAHRPEVHDDQLIALHASILAGQRERIAKSYSESAMVIDNIEEHDAQIKSIMSGADAQKTLAYGMKFLDEGLFNENGADQKAAVKEAYRWQERKNKAKQEYLEALKEAQEEVRKAKEKQMQWDNDLFILADQLKNSERQYNFSEDTNEDTNVNENLNYNT